MTNKWLKGNGAPCPECKGERFVPAPGLRLIPCFTSGDARPTHAHFGANFRLCPTCGGDGRVAIPPERIIADDRRNGIG